jgi:hypothetical protein
MSAIKRKCCRRIALGKFRNNKKHSPSPKQFEQRCRNLVVAFTAIVEGEKKKRLGRPWLCLSAPNICEAFEGCNREMPLGPFKLLAKLRLQGKRRLVHGDNDASRLPMRFLQVESQGVEMERGG